MEKHIPKDHQHHGADEPCGCWTGEADVHVILCPGCGAAYKAASVHHFPRWHCYDCESLVYAEDAGRPELP